MASMANAFDLLVGTGEVLQKPKKKKNNKPKPAKPAAANGDAAAPVSAEVAKVRISEAPVAKERLEVVVAEACAILEQSARSSTSGNARIAAWKDWAKQAADVGPKAIRYVDVDGKVLTFKQVMLRSRALELTLQSCLAQPLAEGQEADLQQLLATFLPGAPSAQLASAVARLGVLLAADAHSFDSAGAAQRALLAVVGALKAAPKAGAGGASAKGSVLSEWTGKLEAVDDQLAAKNTALVKLAQAGAPIAKPHMECARNLVALQAEKLDLLLSPAKAAGGGGAGSGAAAARSVAELKRAITEQLQAALAREQGGKGAAAGPSAAQAAATLKREDATLAQQATSIAGQIKALEAQLAGLRSQAAELDDRRSSVASRLKSALAAASGGQAAASAVQVPPSHYQEELAAADKLAALVDPSASLGDGAADAVAAVRAANQDTAWHYQQSCRQLLIMGADALAEVPAKVAFAKQRKEKAERLLALATTSGKKDAATSSSKQAADSSKLLDETMAWAQEVAKTCAEARDGVAARFAALAGALPVDQAARLQPALAELDSMAAIAAQRYNDAVAHANGTAPPPPAPSAAVGVRVPPPVPAAAAPIAPPTTAGAGGAASRVVRPPANGAAAAPAASEGDGFMQVAGKKGRRKA